jgi:hypothetical protein
MDPNPDLMSQNTADVAGPSLRLPGLLCVPRTATVSEHRAACRFGQVQRDRDHALAHRDVLHGVRIMKYPFMALASATHTKRARHVLSQKVIAGTMKVHPPYVSDPKS